MSWLRVRPRQQGIRAATLAGGGRPPSRLPPGAAAPNVEVVGPAKLSLVRYRVAHDECGEHERRARRTRRLEDRRW
jgi:hypothetical protein